ncbi:putative hydroxymethylpyrimidine transport system substrate-binding protein [Tistlia consotensis]|uniref:Putative hydroxymethylpyrimidine transport system substrate-binding protein n=1 Tax=Tistlia consotensis USBA 355 TaxID=560819 RepID=A0A1Y6BX90_9PROT|nr:ABC transporter substrate-binding protein [Tistlia consotensis]SMF33596.1 putative hydroxymethylpyrimidine transport system substrate-binding protein [Tistlia consotensis USBA 355]SNR69896.1 putative hydroxymethylpyrimidine transport system substrate-binding protein [Tistlia consotensis]
MRTIAPRTPFTRTLFAWTLFALLLAGAAQATPAAQAATGKYTVLLDWFLNPDHAPLVVALEKGFFTEEGLDVELVEPADPNDPPKLVAAGQADLAVSYQPMLHIQVAAGLPLTRIGTLIATPLNALLTLADGPVKTIENLKGKRVGYSVGGFEEALLKTMLERHGLSLKDITLVNVNFALSQSLLSHQVDAVIGAYRNFDSHQLEQAGAKGRFFYVEEEGVPPFDELILVARSDVPPDPRQAAFLRALEKGVQFLVNHPEESWELFVKYKPDLDDKLNREIWDDTLRRFALRPAASDAGRYRRFAKFLQDQGVVGALPPVESYLREAD